jgi:hypothetical protein
MGIMFVLRFLLQSVVVWIATKLLGGFMPIIRRLLRLIGW